MATGLGLSHTAFDAMFEKPMGIQRVIRYPSQNVEEKNALGASAHVDYGAITLVQEDSPGLEVFVPGGSGWRLVVCPPGHTVASIGFMLEKLTGGALRATQHRVINRNAKPRYSSAFFYDPNPAASIAPLLPVAAQEDASKYKPCIAGQKGVRYATQGYSSKPVRAE